MKMKTKKNYFLPFLLASILIFSACGEKVKNGQTDLKGDTVINADEYTSNAFSLKKHLTAVEKLAYHNGKINITGIKYDRHAEFIRKDLAGNSISETVVFPEEYAYSPFEYKNGKLYGRGLSVKGEQDDIFPENCNIISLFTDNDGTEYRIIYLGSSHSYFLNVTASNGDSIFMQKISTLDGADEYIDKKDTYFFSDIFVKDGVIYLSAFSIDENSSSDNSKGYIPYIFMINNASYNIYSVIDNADISSIDHIIDVSENKIGLSYCDSDKNVTEVCCYDILKGETVVSLKIDSISEPFFISENEMIYFDKLTGKLIKHQNKTSDETVLCDLSEYGDDVNVIDLSDNIVSYMILNESNTSKICSVAPDGNITEEKDLSSEFFLEHRLLEENKKDSPYIWNIKNYFNENIAVLENETFNVFSDMDYDEKYFYISDNDTVYAYDKNGKKAFDLSIMFNNKIYCFGNEKHKYIAGTDEKKNLNVYEINAESKSKEFVFSINDFAKTDGDVDFYDGDSSYSFYMKDKNGIIYGFDAVKKKADVLLDLCKFNINDEIKGICIEESGVMICTQDNLYLLSKGKSEEISEKENIVIAVSGGRNYSKLVSLYNEQNEKYNIEIKTNSSGQNGTEILYQNILNGEKTDMIIGSNISDIQPLIKTGIFSDVSSFLKNDDDYISGKYLTNIIDSFSEQGGKQYMIPLSFAIRGMTIRSDDAFDTLTYDILENAVNESGAAFISMPYAFILDGNRDFINYENNFVSYKNETLKRFMNSYKENYGGVLESRISVRERSFEAASAGMDHAYGGQLLYPIPSVSGESNYYAESDDIILISQNSEYKEQCWEFIKFLIGDEAQKNINEYDFPINKNVFDEIMEKCRFETDDEYAGKINDIIENINISYIPNDTIINIINEEINSFMTDLQDADTMLDNIQSRVSLYFNEAF